jgi:hypothetical protein
MTLALRYLLAVLFGIALSPIAIAAALYAWACEGGRILDAFRDAFASAVPWPAKAGVR